MSGILSCFEFFFSLAKPQSRKEKNIFSLILSKYCLFNKDDIIRIVNNL